MKRNLISGLLLLLALSALLSSCNLMPLQEKEFSKAGMTIKLTTAFSEREQVSYTASYISQHVMVMALKEEFSIFGLNNEGEQLTLAEYADMVVEANKKDGLVFTSQDGITSASYTSTVNGDDYTYFLTVYKASDAFWLIQYATKSDKFEEWKDDIVNYAKSVRFD